MVTDQAADILAELLGDVIHQRIRLGVYGGGVERVAAVHNTQETGRLFEGFGPQSWHLGQFLTAGKGAVFVTKGDNIVSQGTVQTRDAAQQRDRGGIQVDADRVHTIFYYGIQ